MPEFNFEAVVPDERGLHWMQLTVEHRENRMAWHVT
jgi:hypothetical protein